jgi:hypothetical protein
MNGFTKLARIPTPIMAVRVFARNPPQARRARVEEGADTMKKFTVSWRKIAITLTIRFRV